MYVIVAEPFSPAQAKLVATLLESNQVINLTKHYMHELIFFINIIHFLH